MAISPNLIPTYHAEGIEVSTAVAAELLLFTSDDPSRPMLSIGVTDGGHLCATDGHVAVRIEPINPNGHVPSAHDGTVFGRATVVAAVKVAKALKSPTVRLLFAWGALDSYAKHVKFPPVGQVIPEARTIASDAGIGLDPRFLAEMGRLAAAVAPPKGAGPRVKLVHVPQVKSNGDFRTFDPTVWEVLAGETTYATVAMMPMRLRG